MDSWFIEDGCEYFWDERNDGERQTGRCFAFRNHLHKGVCEYTQVCDEPGCTVKLCKQNSTYCQMVKCNNLISYCMEHDCEWGEWGVQLCTQCVEKLSKK